MSEQGEQLFPRRAEMAERAQFLERFAVWIDRPVQHFDIMPGVRFERIRSTQDGIASSHVIAVLWVADQVQDCSDGLGMADSQDLSRFSGYRGNHPDILGHPPCQFRNPNALPIPQPGLMG